MVVSSIEVKVQVVGEPLRDVRVRKDANIFEILGGAFAGEEFPDDEKLKLLTKPFKMEEDAVFKFERINTVARLALKYHTPDNRMLRFGVEVSPRATITEIVAEAQTRADEMLEDAKFYSLFVNGTLAIPPWNQPNYELKPKVNLADSVVAKA
jgi:hypothetical protein